jgi:hypothetical protein
MGQQGVPTDQKMTSKIRQMFRVEVAVGRFLVKPGIPGGGPVPRRGGEEHVRSASPETGRSWARMVRMSGFAKAIVVVAVTLPVPVPPASGGDRTSEKVRGRIQEYERARGLLVLYPRNRVRQARDAVRASGFREVSHEQRLDALRCRWDYKDRRKLGRMLGDLATSPAVRLVEPDPRLRRPGVHADSRSRRRRNPGGRDRRPARKEWSRATSGAASCLIRAVLSSPLSSTSPASSAPASGPVADLAPRLGRTG